jgi:hypothetical protein
MPKRGVGFPVDELMVMLDCIKDILPAIGMNEWEMVERRHNQSVSWIASTEQGKFEA